MKRKIITLIGLFFLLSVVSSYAKSNDWKRCCLNGKVKSCYEKFYKAEKKFGEWTNGVISLQNHNKVSFTNDGVYSGTDFFFDSGELYYKSVMKLDGDRTEESFFEKDGKLRYKMIMKKISSDVAETEYYDDKGEMVYKGTSYFDKHVFKKGEYVTYEKGEFKLYRRYEYLAFDKKKNWVKRLSYNSKESTNPDDYIIREIEYY